MDIAGHSAIVTGGSSGIGKAIAHELARRGADIFLIARREDPLKAALAEIQQDVGKPFQRFGFFCADVSDPASLKEAVRIAEGACGPPAILVNSAGISNPGYVDKLHLSSMEEEIRVNYFGTVYMVKQVLSGMIGRRQGWILNVSSLAGLKGLFGYAGYCGSKFAVVGFSEALRSEVRPYNVKVSVLCPPDVDTPMLRRENTLKPPETLKIAETGKVMKAVDVAQAAIQGMERGSFLIIPNLSGKILSFVNSIAPNLLDWYLNRTVDLVRRERKF
ncbi:MAG: hypothetical protein A3K30_01975 [Deltaproteobacteria bacterium RBG_13_51_10]|nr:MAG: hypothetical protein A3K30_01975 [Deltaproteobacteria bacterium RBG_13_51_10]